jgi:hypothetical protein
LDALYPFVDALWQHDASRLRQLILQIPQWETEYTGFEFFMKDGWEEYSEIVVKFFQYEKE